MKKDWNDYSPASLKASLSEPLRITFIIGSDCTHYLIEYKNVHITLCYQTILNSCKKKSIQAQLLIKNGVTCR